MTFDDDFVVRTFQLRGSRVHAAGPGIHGDPTGKWTVYHYPEPHLWPCKLEHVDTFDEALTLARELAKRNAAADREFLGVASHPEGSSRRG